MTGRDDTYDDAALVAEYVLHLLEPEERDAFERRLANDRQLQERVWEWEAQFAPLSDQVAPETPPPALRERILSMVEPEIRPKARAPLWSYLLGGVTAAAIVIVALAVILPITDELAPSYRAELAAEDRSLIIVAAGIPETREIVIERIAGAVPSGRVHELWLIAEGARAPVSLGVLENEGQTRIRVADNLMPALRDGTLAISDEPPGGSPTGAPTGTVVATAQFSDI